MTNTPVTIQSLDVSLTACPINPAWVRDGTPVARMKLLSTSADGTANMLTWDCTAGRFDWFYAIDESFYILEGSARLKLFDNSSKLVGVGDTVFFPAGSHAEWTVEKYIRKVAFCRSPLPAPLAFARSVLRSVKQKLNGTSGTTAPGMFG